MALEGALSEAQLAEFHPWLSGRFGRVGGGIDDETAAERLAFAVLPAEALIAGYVAMHE